MLTYLLGTGWVFVVMTSLDCEIAVSLLALASGTRCFVLLEYFSILCGFAGRIRHIST